MSLPIELQMQIDLTAAAHKREIAEAFSALRKKLLPERTFSPQEIYLQALQAALRPTQWDALQWRGLQNFGCSQGANRLLGPSNSLGYTSMFGGIW